MSYKVRTIPHFEKALKRLAKKYPSLKLEYIALLDSLEENPEQGTSIGNHCFKIRIAIASKGKGTVSGEWANHLENSFADKNFLLQHHPIPHRPDH